MKLFSSFTLIAIVFCSTTSLSQTITVRQLIDKTKCNDFICFDNFIKEKKFSFFKKIENGGDSAYVSYYYLSDETFTSTANSSPSSSDRNIANVTINFSGNVETSFGTSVKQQFDKLMSELKQLKFSYKREKKFGTQAEKDGRRVYVEYLSPLYPKIEITVTTTRMIKDENSSNWWVSYRLSVERIK